MFRLPFLEDCTPPPFYQPQLTDKERRELDEWFIGKRSQQYYLHRFAQMDMAGRLHTRWHWSAFATTFGWLLYRKRYLDCLVYCVAGWSFIKLNVVIILAICEFLFVRHLGEDVRIYVRLGIGLGVWVFWSGYVARWADAYYYRVARREIADVLTLYPKNKEAQKEYLAHHGGVSIGGLLGAFGIFGVILAIIVVQFVPIVAISKEQQVIYESYQMANAVQKRVAVIYDKTGKCPTDLPASITDQKVSVVVQSGSAGINTDCAVVATVTKAGYPVRYLNGRNLVMYRHVMPDGKVVWRCQSSLNKKQTPKKCIG